MPYDQDHDDPFLTIEGYKCQNTVILRNLFKKNPNIKAIEEGIVCSWIPSHMEHSRGTGFEGCFEWPNTWLFYS